MKKLLTSSSIFAFVLGLGLMFNTTPVHAGWVNGYYRSNGTYVSSYYRSYPSYRSYRNYTPSYRSYYTPSYRSYRSYPSYRSGLMYQRGYYKPSTGSWVSGHYKTYSDGYKWNNRKSLYGW